jgi:hypothetical protein
MGVPRWHPPPPLPETGTVPPDAAIAWTRMTPGSAEYRLYESHELSMRNAMRDLHPASPAPALEALSHHADDTAAIARYGRLLACNRQPGFYVFEIVRRQDATGEIRPPVWMDAETALGWMAARWPRFVDAAVACLSNRPEGATAACAVVDGALGRVRLYAVPVSPDHPGASP